MAKQDGLVTDAHGHVVATLPPSALLLQGASSAKQEAAVLNQEGTAALASNQKDNKES
jgi:hypothetical protein